MHVIKLHKIKVTLSGKESACQCRRLKRWRLSPWVGKVSWRREWQPTPVFLPGKSHGQRSLVGYTPWSFEEWNMTEWPNTNMRTRPHTCECLCTWLRWGWGIKANVSSLDAVVPILGLCQGDRRGELEGRIFWISLYYFLQCQMNQQLFQNEEFLKTSTSMVQRRRCDNAQNCRHKLAAIWSLHGSRGFLICRHECQWGLRFGVPHP